MKKKKEESDVCVFIRRKRGNIGNKILGFTEPSLFRGERGEWADGGRGSE